MSDRSFEKDAVYFDSFPETGTKTGMAEKSFGAISLMPLASREALRDAHIVKKPDIDWAATRSLNSISSQLHLPHIKTGPQPLPQALEQAPVYRYALLLTW